MATKKQQTQMSISALSAKNEHLIRDGFMTAVENSQEAVVISAVSEAISAGDIPGVESSLRLDNFESEFSAASNGQREAFKQGADSAHGELPKFLQREGRSIDLLNPIASAFLEAEGAALVTAVSDSTREAITNTLSQVIESGVHPTRAAKQLRDTIGLNRVQAGAIEKQRGELAGQGLTQAKIDKVIDRRIKKMIASRARTISRTETMKAVSAGRQRMWEQLKEDDIIDEDAQKQWVTSNDERVGSDHEPMNGVTVGINEEFFIPETGQYVMTPNESRPNCRCTAVIVFN